jgi:uncharacterized protein DUF3311
MPKRLSLGLAAIPALALTFAVPLVNRDEPRVFGLPFVLFWIILWIALSTAFLWFIHRKVEGRT